MEGRLMIPPEHDKRLGGLDGGGGGSRHMCRAGRRGCWGCEQLGLGPLPLTGSSKAAQHRKEP